MTAPATNAERLAAAEPATPKELGSLLERLRAAGMLLDVEGADVGAARAAGAAGVAAVPITGVTNDSRSVRAGTLFVAVPGAHVDGHDFVAAARDAGAPAVLVERLLPDLALPQVRVASTQRALAVAASWWYEDPSARLGIVGITGTDGKTTTSFLAAAALQAAGVPTGMIGTVATTIGGHREANEEHATTPDAPRLQAALRAMLLAGDRAAVVETTSHGLALERVGGIAYDVGILTNLTHEHLEFHGTWEAYRAAKRSLFERLGRGSGGAPKPQVGWQPTGIVNADDPSADVFAAATREAGARLLMYGASRRADIRLVEGEEDARRLRVVYEAPHGRGRIDLRLAGAFNAYNALAVVALGEALGLDPAAVRAGLEGVTSVPGRMERIVAGQPFGVVVDYAHSPASLETVLDLLAPVARSGGGEVIAVFGSAGERDRAKRPMMGRIAAERCRLVVATDEDPRGEDPMAILEEIADGAEAAGGRRGESLLLTPDRRVAIREAFARARPGDVVLLAGKGHERSIIYAAGALPWDEASEARAALRELGYAG